MDAKADVACTSTTVASAILALEISKDFLLSLKREGKNFLEETNSQVARKLKNFNRIVIERDVTSGVHTGPVRRPKCTDFNAYRV